MRFDLRTTRSDRRFPAFLLPWQDAITAIKQILSYTSQPFHIGNWHISSVIGLITGILIFVVALFLSRTIRTLLERRIAKRTHIDPGVRYTLARLANYFIIAVGILAALKVAFENFDLTSIAVVFTALSVGIGLVCSTSPRTSLRDSFCSSNGPSGSVIASPSAKTRATFRA